MSPSPLEALPAETLHGICEYLDSRSKAHLNAFSRASKTCYASAVPCLYRIIRFHVPALDSGRSIRDGPHIMKDQQRLATDVEHWQSLVERDAAHKHVLCIKIWAPESNRPAKRGCQEQFDFIDNDDDFADPPCRSLDTPWDLKYAKVSADDNELSSWSALAKFIAQLPALRDLHFDCSRPLPACLSQALHE